MKRFSAFVIVFFLGCQVDEPKQALDMGQDLGQDLGADLETRDMADELLYCQHTASADQTCASPDDVSVRCCPISDGECEGRYMGGTAEKGKCSYVFDSGGTSFTGRDENGCFYVLPEGNCLDPVDL